MKTATLGFFLIPLLISCSPPCGNEVIETKTNNNGLVAVLFERNCGATTAYSYHISILPEGDELGEDETGGIYVSESSEVAFEWIAPRQLGITSGSALSDTFKMKREFAGVEIIYD